MGISPLNDKLLKAGTCEAFSAFRKSHAWRKCCVWTQKITKLQPGLSCAFQTQLTKAGWTNPRQTEERAGHTFLKYELIPKKVLSVPLICSRPAKHKPGIPAMGLWNDYFHMKEGISTLKNFQFNFLEVSKLQLCWLEDANDF